MLKLRICRNEERMTRKKNPWKQIFQNALRDIAREREKKRKRGRETERNGINEHRKKIIFIPMIVPQTGHWKSKTIVSFA